MTEPVVVQGAILVPYVLLQDRQAVEIEHLLEAAGLLPPQAQEKRWQQDTARYGYVLTFTYALAVPPSEGP